MTRQLRFIVNGQTITKDPSCDFSGIVAGSQNYLEAVFVFSSEWKDCLVAASFYCILDEYPVVLNNNRCMIPKEALGWNYFDVAVTGVNRRKNYTITTSKIRVDQQPRG